MKKFLALLLALLTLLSLTACGSSSKTAESYVSDAADYTYDASAVAEENGYWEEPAAPAEAAGGNTGSTQRVNNDSKMVYTANFELQTLEFDQADSSLQALVESMGGYFESRSLNNYGGGYRSAHYTVRVPAAQYNAFCDATGSRYHVTYFNENAENISETYYDTKARLETAQIKLERLQELLKKAESMEDIITIENSITDVEYTIENLSGTMRHYDALVDYATVYVSLYEVYKLDGTETAPLTFGERLVESFRNGFRSVGEFLEGLAMALAYSWIYLLAIAAAVVIAVRALRKRRKNRKAAEE